MTESLLRGHGCAVVFPEMPELEPRWVVKPDYPFLRAARTIVSCLAEKTGYLNPTNTKASLHTLDTKCGSSWRVRGKPRAFLSVTGRSDLKWKMIRKDK